MFKRKPVIYRRLNEHFGTDPAEMLVISQQYGFYQRANVHYAIEELLGDADPNGSLVGIVVNESYESISLGKLSRPLTSVNYDEGPVQYVDEPLPNDQRVSCIRHGLHLISLQGKLLALLISEASYGPHTGIVVEVMAEDKAVVERVAARLERSVRFGKAFRGAVLSLERDCYGNTNIKFHNLPLVTREQIILPQALLDRIERSTIAFSKHAERLKASGRHLKRGVLLHGPPGTGKTLSAMYLSSQMPGRTVFLLTGGSMNSIEAACGMARVLTPATIILEDVDLIGTERNQQSVGANALLFELLNQMEGLSEDADVLFILTTNRPQILEPALAARPGRVDLAIEVPPPDAECRMRLFQLYANGLQLKINRLDEFIQRTEGVSGAFIREWLRKAAMFAALASDGELVVSDEHLEEALMELLVAGGPLTQSLLGGARSSIHRADGVG